jgi:hypothetical protein
MEFAIAPDHDAGMPEGPGTWQVLLLARERGQEVAQPLASFGCRAHAEAFLCDLLANECE